MKPLRVLSVASEMFPLIKTGGLADVVGALPGALSPHGVQVCTLLPGYPAVMATIKTGSVCADWPNFFGGAAKLHTYTHQGLSLLVLDAPHLYGRAGNPYVDSEGQDWLDNAERFAALAMAAARIAWGEVQSFKPDIVHVHDWQAALLPAYLRYLSAGRAQPKTVLTIHNLAFQGRFNASVWSRLALPDSAFAAEGVEYHGDIGYLKSGILLADAITTVSPSYAQEICTPAGGMGLDAILRWRGGALAGIVNGIDTDIWNPASDTHLAQTYTAKTLSRRAANKRAVEAHFGLAADESPLICMISRLTTQKGIDLVAQQLDAIVATGARLVVLGAGDAALEAAMRAGAARHPQRVAVQIGYDEALSHSMQGGCDAILVPSRFEPCGLTQLYGLRYGCVPIVSRVGGLADTVIDANEAALRANVATGVQLSDVSADGLVAAVARAVRLYQQPELWQRIQTSGMTTDVSWQRSAAEYASLYRQLINA